jgi:hypothetical protein
MSPDTKAATINTLVEQFRDAGKAVDRGLELADVIELIGKLDALGDVTAQIQTAEKTVSLLRSLRTTRAQSTLDALMKRRDSLRKAKELLHTIGNLARLEDQIAVLEKVRVELLKPHDIDTLIRQVADLGPKLDALGELIECLNTWEPW